MKLMLSLSVLTLTASSFAGVWSLSANMDTVQHGHSGLSGTGVFAGSYDDVTNILSIGSMSAQNLTGEVTVSHIHQGAAGVNGGVVVNFGALGSWSGSGNATYTPNGSTATLTEAQEALLLSEGLYINVHTGQFPGGEIRGQIEAVPEPATMALLGLGALAAFKKRKKS